MARSGVPDIGRRVLWGLCESLALHASLSGSSLEHTFQRRCTRSVRTSTTHSSSGPDPNHDFVRSTHAHAFLPSFFSPAIFIKKIPLFCMAEPTLLSSDQRRELRRPPTPNHTQTLRPRRLAQSTHTGRQAKRLQRPSSVSPATTAIAGTRQTLTVPSAITPFTSPGLIADHVNCIRRFITVLYYTIVGREWYRTSAAG